MLNRDIECDQSDPIIVWPDIEPSLRTLFTDLQRLNPSLDLRYAIEYREAYDETYLLIDAAGSKVRQTKTWASRDAEYLIHRGTGLDLVTLSMPEPVTDALYHAICSVNTTFRLSSTDLGVFKVDPKRVDRLGPEELQIRPRSRSVQNALSAFSDACLRPTDDNDVQSEGPQIKGPWSFYIEDEVWGVDFACLPPRHQLDRQGRQKTYLEWLRTPLLGVISYVDRNDLPIKRHLLRARQMVIVGCSFAVVADIERGEIHISQASNAVVSEPIRLPQIPWFDIPVGRRG